MGSKVSSLNILNIQNAPCEAFFVCVSVVCQGGTSSSPGFVSRAVWFYFILFKSKTMKPA